MDSPQSLQIMTERFEMVRIDLNLVHFLCNYGEGISIRLSEFGEFGFKSFGYIQLIQANPLLVNIIQILQSVSRNLQPE